MSQRIRNHRRKYLNKGLRKVKSLIKDKDKVLYLDSVSQIIVGGKEEAREELSGTKLVQFFI